MMRRRWVLTAVVLVVVSCAGGAVQISDLQEKDGVSYVENSQAPFEGQAISSYENGQMEVRKSFAGGRVDGVWTEWYKDDQKRYEGTWKEGKQNGKSSHWYLNGQLKLQEEYEMDAPAGVHQEWFENGQIMCKKPYVEGRPFGVWQYWQENGRKDRAEVYEDGVLARTD